MRGKRDDTQHIGVIMPRVLAAIERQHERAEDSAQETKGRGRA